MNGHNTKITKESGDTISVEYEITESEDGTCWIVVKCSQNGESVHINTCSKDKFSVRTLLAKMARCEVTPCTAEDVIRDYFS